MSKKEGLVVVVMPFVRMFHGQGSIYLCETVEGVARRTGGPHDAPFVRLRSACRSDRDPGFRWALKS